MKSRCDWEATNKTLGGVTQSEVVSRQHRVSLLFCFLTQRGESTYFHELYIHSEWDTKWDGSSKKGAGMRIRGRHYFLNVSPFSVSIFLSDEDYDY